MQTSVVKLKIFIFAIIEKPKMKHNGVSGSVLVCVCEKIDHKDFFEAGLNK